MNFSKLFPWICLTAAIAISLVAAWYSIVGLAAMFAGAKLAVMLMGGALESGKLVAASWVRRYWNRSGARFIRGYLLGAAVVLVFITSIGIFGFLSRAHLEQTAGVDTGTAQISYYEQEIASLNKNIEIERNKQAGIEQALQGLNQYNRFSKSLNERKALGEELTKSNEVISAAQSRIVQLQEKLVPAKLEAEKKAVEVGPLKYVSELVFGDQSSENVDKATRFMIIILIFVFDPLAVLLLLAAQISFEIEYGRKVITEDFITPHKKDMVGKGTEVTKLPKTHKMRDKVKSREIRDNAADAIIEEIKNAAAIEPAPVQINPPSKLNLFRRARPIKKPFKFL